jgi:ElaB/YqjD/DUF883 family membrane-anchored ribosome-binding protein
MRTDLYIDNARDYANQARRVASDYADDARGRMQRGAGRVQAGAQEYADHFGTRVSDHPLPYVMAAALLGFVLGRVFRA